MNARTILALAPGSSNLHFSEFRPHGSELTLIASGAIPLTIEGTPPANRDAALARAFSALVQSRQTLGRHVCVSIPASQVFAKFIRLPKVENLKVKQMMYFEARQNLPFPPEEMVWDFQALPPPAAGANKPNEAEYLLAGVKPETVETIFRAAESAGLKLELLDIPQTSLANAWRFNYPGLAGCSLLVDIGAKTTNLLFFQDDQFYCRTLPIGGHALTQEFMAETKCSLENAERFKLDQGFIHPGGAIELSENDEQMFFSKLARQWATRLHQQIAQTVQHYRGQMNGKNPERIFLAGMGASLGGMEEFFAEKFQAPVDYFDPFRKLAIDPELDGTAISHAAHSRGETVGMALRMVANCPFELNLVPKAIRARNAWDQKKPYLFASVVCLAASLLGAGYFYREIAEIKRQSLVLMNPKLDRLSHRTNELEKERKKVKQTKAEVDQLSGWLNERFLWADTLTDMQKTLLEVEVKHSAPGKPAGVWIESMKPAGTEPDEEEAAAPLSQGLQGIPEYMRRDLTLFARYYPELFKQMSRPVQPQFPDTGTRDKQKKDSQQYTLLLRAVNLAAPINPGKNSLLAFDVADAFGKEKRFVAAGTGLRNHIENAGPDAITFTFDMKLELAPANQTK